MFRELAINGGLGALKRMATLYNAQHMVRPSQSVSCRTVTGASL
jgi:hypothetical protein